jgi:hypothetical protein
MHVADDDVADLRRIDTDREQPSRGGRRNSRPRFFAIASSNPVSRINVRSSPTIAQTK